MTNPARRAAWVLASAIGAVSWATVARATGTEAPPDVAGVTLGMTLDQAKAAIAKVNPKYEFEPMKDKQGKVIGWQALVPSPRFTGLAAKRMAPDVFWALADTRAGTTWYVARKQLFGDDSASVDKAKMVKAFTDKFGPPSVGTERDAFFYWMYDRGGALSAGGKTLLAQPCDVNAGIPVHFRATCGTVVSANLEVGDWRKPNLIGGYTLSVANHAVRYDEAGQTPAEKAAALSARQSRNEAPKF
jgi:hypothetical protein